MDEILIEEKKYVSSKRAAKITGYAKDYVGQLCREGRVPARLVGRGWYVLESAIQDHRFGATDVQPEEVIQTVQQAPVLKPAWESPRYEASSDELLPSINRLRSIEAPISISSNEKDSEFSQHLEDSWRAWFDRVGDADASGSMGEDIEPVAQATAQEPEKNTEEPRVPEIHEDNEVNIPIHTIYQAPPEELLPHHHVTVEPPSEKKQPIQREEKKRGKRSVIIAMQLVGGFIAMIFAATAIISSGYFNTYILSNKQVMLIAGMSIYNK